MPTFLAKMPPVIYTVFPPGKPLKWSPDFAPFEMKRLFEDRERLFALQRKLDQPDLQKRAEEAVRGHEASLAKMRRNVLLSYRRFCTAANIPPWPVTDPIRALCVVAKFSGGSYGYRSLWGLLSTLANMTGAFFRSEPAYIELLSLKAPSQAAFKTKDVTILDSISEDVGLSSESETDDEEATTPMTSLQPSTSQQSFATVNDALVACAIPLIKTYGYSARIERPTDTHAFIYCNRHNSYYHPRCCYHWALTFAEEKRAWVIDLASSELSHNHGMTPELAKDPTWRPRLHTQVVKKALELADAPSTQRIGKRASRTDNGGRPRPNARPESGAPDENKIVASQAAAKRPKMNTIPAMRPPPIPAADKGGPRLKPTAGNERAIHLVAAFFAAAKDDLHLVPLAAAFVEEGLKTVEDLTKFACLDPAIRDSFIRAVQKKFYALDRKSVV